MTFEHSSDTNSHYTPPEVVEAARAVMGAIDLDPFSCEKANEVVKAAEYWSRSGFENAWRHEVHAATFVPARVFCNPPGGKLSRKDLSVITGGPGYSSASIAWAKLVHEYELGNVEQAVFVCFNLEVLRTSQLIDGVRSVLEFPLCVPRDRLRFWNEGTPIGKGQPKYPNAIVYLPRVTHLIADTIAFRQNFAQFGACR